MNRFAATLMALACLLYVAMPVWAAPVGTPAMPMMQHDHAAHDMSNMAGIAGMDHEMAMDHGNHAGKGSKPCPHGAEGCVTPFCSACLVVLPQIGFPPLGRFAFSYPAPSPARKMIAHAPALNPPPPRA